VPEPRADGGAGRGSEGAATYRLCAYCPSLCAGCYLSGMRSGRALLLAGFLLFLASCKDATQVLVRFEAQPATAARADRLRVVIHGQDQSVRLDQTGRLKGATAQLTLPTVVPISPLGGDVSRIFHIEGELLDAEDVVFSEVRLTTGFVEKLKRELTLVFYDNCIDRFECSWEQTCQDGQCVDAYVPRPGEDAGVPDTGMCPDSPCRLQAPQCGCADGLSCQDSGDPRCLPAGPGAPGEGCLTSSDCNGGMTCWGILPLPGGTCQPYCSADDECPDTFCLGPPLAPAGVCLIGCDPVAQVGCPTGQSCGLTFGLSHEGGPDQASTTCGTVGSAPEGTVCTGMPTICGIGLGCANGSCARICRVGSDSDCAGGQVCGVGDPPFIAAGVEYGACI